MKNNTTILIRITDLMKSDLQKIADNKGISASDIIRMTLASLIRNHKAKETNNVKNQPNNNNY